MSYSTFDDMKRQLPEATIAQLTNDEGAGDTVDMATLEAAQVRADEMIDGYLRGRYELPFSSPPALLKNLSVELTGYFLYTRRLDQEMPEGIRNRYKDAVKLLERIQEGKVSLGIASADTGSEPGEYRTNKTSSDRLFSKKVLDAF